MKRCLPALLIVVGITCGVMFATSKGWIFFAWNWLAAARVSGVDELMDDLQRVQKVQNNSLMMMAMVKFSQGKPRYSSNDHNSISIWFPIESNPNVFGRLEEMPNKMTLCYIESGVIPDGTYSPDHGVFTHQAEITTTAVLDLVEQGGCEELEIIEEIAQEAGWRPNFGLPYNPGKKLKYKIDRVIDGAATGFRLMASDSASFQRLQEMALPRIKSRIKQIQLISP